MSSVPSEVSKYMGNAVSLANIWGTLLYNVKSYGAKGDGVTDDISAINATITEAKKTKGVVIFPSSATNYRISTPINVDPSFSILSFGSTTIESIGSSTDGIVFTTGNYYSKYMLPNVVNFTNGSGIRLVGASLLNIEVDNVANCKDGITIEASASNWSLDNTIQVQAVNSCTSGAGLKFKGTATGATIQGNVIRGNFFTGNLYGVYFDSPPSSSINWDDNYVEIAAIEGFGSANSKGISQNNGLPPGRLTIKAPTFFGGFASTPWIDGGGNNNTYELAFVGIDIPYNAVSLNGVGNKIVNVGNNYSGAITGSGLQAATVANSRATFNGGNANFSNKLFIQMNVPALTAGQTVDFWIYSPFTIGYSHNVSITPHFYQPLVVICIEDSSVRAGIDGNASPNQIHIRLMAVGTVTAAQQTATVSVGL